MAPNGSHSFKIPAKVFPGVFPGEFQVTIEAEGQQVHLNVSGDFVEFTGTPTEEGADGFLLVDIVGDADGLYLVALPGEPQGTTSRVTLTKDALQVA